MSFDEDLDCSGLICPLPVLRARKRLLGMAPGAILRIRATDPMALIDLPHFCAGAGHEVLDCVRSDDASVWLIRRGQ